MTRLYRRYDTDFGKGACLYRDTAEIYSDIRDLREQIALIKDNFNHRELLLGIINDERCKNPKELIKSLEDLVVKAEETALEISNLKDELTVLEEELRETRCAFRIL